ncbi:hypothetical protein HZA55_07605 [Candidatus Poribacteria bacterium]|nr:hypothetical protein [Candidatus Poribacteria bacterium]
MKYFSILSIIACLIFLYGCSPKTVLKTQEYSTSKGAKININYNKVYDCSLQVAKEFGYEIESNSIKTGVIKTSSRDSSNRKTQRKIVLEFGAIANNETMMLIHMFSVEHFEKQDEFNSRLDSINQELDKIINQIVALSKSK